VKSLLFAEQRNDVPIKEYRQTRTR
jgi:hypothetical protein